MLWTFRGTPHRLLSVRCPPSQLGQLGADIIPVNFFADPHAAYDVLNPTIPDQGFPRERFILVPLDVTTPHEIPFSDYKAEVDPEFENTSSPSNPTGKPPLLHFTSAFLERTREVMLSFGKDAMELHDPVAVWFATENPPGKESAGQVPVLTDGWGTTRRQFQVERWVFHLICIGHTNHAALYASQNGRIHTRNAGGRPA